jgi:hypothetical protein
LMGCVRMGGDHWNAQDSDVWIPTSVDVLKTDIACDIAGK